MNLETLTKIAVGKIDRKNAGQVLTALMSYGPKFGLDQPHRQVQYLAQLFHESGSFKYDREIWGPTPAQERYDTRTDLGNTPERDGDGKKYMGRTGIQLTGKENYAAFRDWCRKFDPAAPDFVKSPDLVNTDPWEGLAPIWFWTKKGLNRYADKGDVEMITRRVNGGLNGYADRVKYLVRASLVYLGYTPDAVKEFQRDYGLVVDNDPGPNTRAKLHQALLKRTPKPEQSSGVQKAPVVENKNVAVTPDALDKPVQKTVGFWERISGLTGLTGIVGAASWLNDWRIIVAMAGGLIVLTLFGLYFHSRIIDAVKRIKEEV